MARIRDLTADAVYVDIEESLANRDDLVDAVRRHDCVPEGLGRRILDVLEAPRPAHRPRLTRNQRAQRDCDLINLWWRERWLAAELKVASHRDFARKAFEALRKELKEGGRDWRPGTLTAELKQSKRLRHRVDIPSGMLPPDDLEDLCWVIERSSRKTLS